MLEIRVLKLLFLSSFILIRMLLSCQLVYRLLTDFFRVTFDAQLTNKLTFYSTHLWLIIFAELSILGFECHLYEKIGGNFEHLCYIYVPTTVLFLMTLNLRFEMESLTDFFAKYFAEFFFWELWKYWGNFFFNCPVYIFSWFILGFAILSKLPMNSLIYLIKKKIGSLYLLKITCTIVFLLASQFEKKVYKKFQFSPPCFNRSKEKHGRISKIFLRLNYSEYFEVQEFSLRGFILV